MNVRPKWPPICQVHALSKQRYREWVGGGGRPYSQSHPLKKAYKEAKHAFRREFRKLRHEEMEEFYKSLDPTDPRIFYLIKQKLGTNPHPTNHLKVNGISYNEAGIPEGWALYFESLYTPSPMQYDVPHFHHISNELQVLLLSADDIDDTVVPVFSPYEIQSLIKTLPRKKATGPDSLFMEHFIYAPPSVFLILANLFNAILQFHHVPSSFCTSLIIPLFKGGNKDPTDPASYRGISLSSNLSKIFERLLQVLQTKLLPLLHHRSARWLPARL